MLASMFWLGGVLRGKQKQTIMGYFLHKSLTVNQRCTLSRLSAWIININKINHWKVRKTIPYIDHHVFELCRIYRSIYKTNWSRRNGTTHMYHIFNETSSCHLCMGYKPCDTWPHIVTCVIFVQLHLMICKIPSQSNSMICTTPAQSNSTPPLECGLVWDQHQ